MTTAADVLNVARSYIGVYEDPPHSNRTIIGEKFGWNGVPWCAESVSVWQSEAGNSAFNGSASCWTLVSRYRDGSNGTWGVDPEPGDEGFIGTSGQDHTFLVEVNHGDGTVTTIEGNWGDRCTRVRRTISSIYGFGRPHYDGGGDTTTPPSQTGGRPLLREGSIGQAVVAWQQCLAITADGIFGPQTTAATKAFQSKAGIAADGVVGPDTYAAMDRVLAYLATLPANPTAPGFQATVLRGSKGSTVRAVQQQLAHRGWKIAVDGDFGPATEKVVKAFQSEKGLAADGIVGPVTWNALWTAPL